MVLCGSAERSKVGTSRKGRYVDRLSQAAATLRSSLRSATRTRQSGFCVWPVRPLIAADHRRWPAVLLQPWPSCLPIEVPRVELAVLRLHPSDPGLTYSPGFDLLQPACGAPEHAPPHP